METRDDNPLSLREVAGAVGGGPVAFVVQGSAAAQDGVGTEHKARRSHQRKYPNHPFKLSRSPGPASRATWIRAGSRRDELSRLGSARRPQGSDHRRRFRHGPRRRDRLRARRRRRRDQLFARRGARRARSHRADQGGRSHGVGHSRRPSRRGVLQEAGRGCRERSRRPRHPCQQRRTPADAAPRSSTFRPRISTRR